MSDEKKTLHSISKDELDNALDDTNPAGTAADPHRTAPTLAGSPEQLAANAAAEQEALSARIRESIRSTGARVRVDPLIGKVVGDRFEIISKIGTGGMGTVYKARQRGMDRFAAVKVLLKQYLTNETLVRRFKREALAVSKLVHPNTVRIYDLGQSDEGILYIAMEHLSGSTLAHLVRSERQLSIRRSLRMVRQICLSLSEAHEKGVIHRDLKPDNIFVSEGAEKKDVIKVLDFGVAKLREANEDSGTLTQHGTIFGTPKYMSPEQCRCDDVDGRSDLYALGVVLYEMISARVPFDSDNPLAILIMHAQESVRPLSEVRPDLVIPFDVEELLHRMLAKRPSERPDTAQALIVEIDRLLNQLPEEFERVLTYQAAEEAGMSYDRSHAFTVPDAPARGGPMTGETLDDPRSDMTMAVQGLPPLRKKKRSKMLVMVATLVIVLVSTAAVLYAQLQSIPDDMQRLVPERWANLNDATPIRTPKLDLVTVTARSNVGGVSVVDEKTGRSLPKRIEEPDQPVTFQWLRENRTITLRFEHAGATSVSRKVDLSRDNTLETAVFESAEAPVVQLTIQANVGGGRVSIGGSDRLYVMPDNPDTARTIPVPKGGVPTTISMEKPGYKTAKRSFSPSADDTLVFTLEPDPNAVAIAPTITIDISVNIRPVKILVTSNGRVYEITKPGNFALKLDRTDKPEQLLFTRAGYRNNTQTITLNSDQELTVVMRGKPRTKKQTSTATTLPIKVNPVKEVKKPKPAPRIKVNPIK
jgi:serine/threonine protein kinase